MTLNQRKDVIVFAATICNVESNIAAELSSIINSLEDTQILKIILVESDSSDSTISVVRDLSKIDPRVELHTLGTLRHEIPDRIERIRHCRQVYVQRIRELSKFNQIDYVVIADLDGMNSKLAKEAINRTLGLEGWDVALANQKGGYYDLLALRHSEWMPRNCFQEYYDTLNKVFDAEKDKRRFKVGLWRYFKADSLKTKFIYSKMRRIRQSDVPFQVDSGFGGFAIYRRFIFDSLDYVLDATGLKTECEHITLSRKIRNKGLRIYIHPWLINSNWNTYNINRIALIRHARALRNFFRRSFMNSFYETK